MAYVDKETLFKSRLAEAEDVEIPGVGVVRVRGLNRLEVMHAQAADGHELDRRIIAQGLVEPELVIHGLKHRDDATPCEACADAKKWQEASPAGELEPVTDRIAQLSGMTPGADKEANKSLPDGSES